MKTKIASLVLSFILSSFSIFAQDVVIKSKELDRIIWEKINEYRVSKGLNSIKIFEEDVMKGFCSRTSARLIQEGAPFAHNPQDTIGYWINGWECIFRTTRTSSIENKYITAYESGDLNTIANLAVDSWIASETHNYAISLPAYIASTVSTIIIYNKQTKRFRMSATWCSMFDTKVCTGPRCGYKLSLR
jgi:hypothetical protein